MKKIRFIYALIMSAVLLGSCEYLDYSEADLLDKEDVYGEFSRMKNVLTQIYTRLPDGFMDVSGAMRSSGTDEAIHVNSLSAVRTFNDGSWNANKPIDNQWVSMYNGIREVNSFLMEIEGETWEELQYDPNYHFMMEEYELYAYEARLLRAFFYFELYKRYGGVPLLGDEMLTEENANEVAHASAQDVIDYIVSECDAVAGVLPTTYIGIGGGGNDQNNSGGDQTGKTTRGFALALKARTLLYAASPLHNTDNSQQKWIDAATAANAVIGLGVYSLEGDYANVVNKPVSTELIFETRSAESRNFEIANYSVGFENGQTGTCPTQNLVDSYEMVATGLPISDPASGYDAANPYAGRDPRLALTVLRNGSTWKGETIEVFYGGRDAAPIPFATLTGYYLKKYLVESVNIEDGKANTKRHVWVLFRYAETLLNYAEAMNEAYGPDDAQGLSMTATDAVNLVRGRAGMPLFNAGMSKDAFRSKLQNERRVELAFEDHRFWDVRRWKTGSETNIKGMTVEQDGSGGYTYTPGTVINRVWDDKMCLYPIPQSEIFKNSNLIQNTGW
ncbi:RagB/SusD family nutrient uptake outer membrane protein [Carboxylicivirga marina]|uniref:RagB/SusD family nutrient uptake outer membrane protein n=1 Tax=Carboxylicivirga marina TaxID=2800988 RepID=UPI002591733D|nr:RagB/SusD family nutrient uptake outer membrane protein [uncultured Carboxylicivirga sp.]